MAAHRRSNCYVWAWAMYLRYGGYRAKRRVRPPLPIGYHWSWSPDRIHWMHFEPVNRLEVPKGCGLARKVWIAAKASIHKLYFKGRIRRYDNIWGEPHTHPHHAWQKERRRFRRLRKLARYAVKGESPIFDFTKPTEYINPFDGATSTIT